MQHVILPLRWPCCPHPLISPERMSSSGSPWSSSITCQDNGTKLTSSVYQVIGPRLHTHHILCLCRHNESLCLACPVLIIVWLGSNGYMHHGGRVPSVESGRNESVSVWVWINCHTWSPLTLRGRFEARFLARVTHPRRPAVAGVAIAR
jgi:hypothetical protein